MVTIKCLKFESLHKKRKQCCCAVITHTHTKKQNKKKQWFVIHENTLAKHTVLGLSVQ